MKSLFAAIILFTRLPLWRIVRVDKKQYAEILLYWPIVGFLTGATTWGTLYLASWVMPLLPACVIAVIARLKTDWLIFSTVSAEDMTKPASCES